MGDGQLRGVHAGVHEERVELSVDARRSVGAAQPAQLELRLGSHEVHVLLSAARLLRASLGKLGLAGLAALLYRHTQQSALSIDVLERATYGTQPEPTTYLQDFALADDSTFEAVLAQLRCPPDSEPALRTSNVAFVAGVDAQALMELAMCGSGRHELVIGVSEMPDGLTLRLTYDARLFRAERAREWLDQYALLLDQLAASPSICVLQPSLLTAAGRALLPDPTQPIALPSHAPLAVTFRACAERLPQHTAIRQAGASFTYAELARCSELIARAVAVRAGRGEVVAVSGPRSFALVSSLLGVLRSGAVLLSLDPALPRERKRMMLDQAKAKLLIAAGDAAADDLPDLPSLHVAADSCRLPAGTPLAPSLPEIAPEQPAYVFFTSGSTGVPKAVLGSQQGLAHFLDWQRNEFQVQATDRASQLTALSFDVVLRDMFLALSSGAMLCLPQGTDVVDPTHVLRWLSEERVSILHVVPSLARLWLSCAPEGLSFPALRLVFFAGEPLSDVLVTRFRQVFGEQVQVVNLYGPTETTLAKCFRRVPAPAEAGVQSIGRPLPQTQVLILNRQRQLCGLHETGEIAIRTPFRSLGYLDNPEATDRAFVPNPFGNDPQDLLYLTGDSGRYRADGLLEILGRMDGQVKIRGVRIEPSEIEAVLGHHPGVREAVVVARQDEAEAKFLVAYVVPHAPEAVGEPAQLSAELRAHLRARLPEVMVPSAFAVLSALPLNPNGKVDKKALPPVVRNTEVAPEAAATSARERELVALWSEVLGLRDVGVHESFYDLGGDSLTAIRAVIRMRAMGIEEPVCRSILQGHTIAQLAAAADGGVLAAPPGPDATRRLVLNALRGLLLLVIFANHMAPGISRRSPRFAAIEEYLYPLFNWATPGFAIAFGMTLGFVYYPQYLQHPQRTRTHLLRGAGIVGVAAAIYALAQWGMRGLSPLHDYETPFANVLSFYALGMLSAAPWFGWLARTRRPSVYAAACAVALWGCQELCVRALGTLPAHSVWFLLIGKWGYVHMWGGALLGFGMGQRLLREVRDTPRHWLAGGALLGVGALLSLRYSFAQAFLTDQVTFEPWKWPFYTGLTLWTLLVVYRVSRALPAAGPARTALNGLAVCGQLTLPLYLAQYFTWCLGMLCTALGQPASVRFSVEFGVFLLVAGWMVQRMYRLFHGSDLKPEIAAADGGATAGYPIP